MTVIAMERNVALVRADGLLTRRGTEFLEDLVRQLNDNLIITSIGNPENVVSATAPRFYLDTAAGDYYKKTGSGDTGWTLI